jgi:hypothetical protein
MSLDIIISCPSLFFWNLASALLFSFAQNLLKIIVELSQISKEKNVQNSMDIEEKDYVTQHKAVG